MAGSLTTPAAKKRKKTLDTYDEFIDVTQRLGKDYNALLFRRLIITARWVLPVQNWIHFVMTMIMHD